MSNYTLKKHSPISKWRNIHDHVSIGDIVYITAPIQKETIRFRLLSKTLKVEGEELNDEQREEIELMCLEHLERGSWSSQFVGYAYLKEGKMVLYSIYDLNFHVYLDGETVQKIAIEYGFEKHPILFHGSVKPRNQESVSDFLKKTVMDSRRMGLSRKNPTKEVVIENVSRLYNHKRIIGSWSFIHKEDISGYKSDKNYILSI
ncbi:hypothetical protein [Rossellomorea marisflavi]|uniref:hypothetical protein n=1 Tax=Rossellomorea marisflavi TaxID=189381 RepID=UPI003FA0784C